MRLKAGLLSWLLVLNEVDVGWFVRLELVVVDRCLGLVDGDGLLKRWSLVQLLLFVVLLVDGEVTLQVAGLRELLGTHVTGVGPLASVNAHVLLEGGRVAEGAWANFASVRLLLGVRAQVFQGVGRVAERLV